MLKKLKKLKQAHRNLNLDLDHLVSTQKDDVKSV